MTANQTPAALINGPCACGCGFGVNHPQSTYLPGHDARHAGQVARKAADLLRGEFGYTRDSERIIEMFRPLSGRLQDKANRLLDRLLAPRPAKKAKKVAAPKFVTGTVKIGRWAYAARRFSDGSVTYLRRNSIEMTEADAKVAATFTAN
jgi:hypothetical protein